MNVITDFFREDYNGGIFGSDYEYFFKGENIVVSLKQSRNGDVYFNFYNNSKSNEVLLTDEFLSPVVIETFNLFFTKLCDVEANSNGFNHFISSSEVILISDEWNENLECNVLIILRNKVGFKFICSSASDVEFVMAFNTDRGHNRAISLLFLDLINNLDNTFLNLGDSSKNEFCLNKKQGFN